MGVDLKCDDGEMRRKQCQLEERNQEIRAQLARISEDLRGICEERVRT